MVKGKRHFVEFIFPDPHIPAGRAEVREIPKRGISGLDIPEGCGLFYLFDAPVDVKTLDEAQDQAFNLSCNYIVIRDETFIRTKEQALEIYQRNKKWASTTRRAAAFRAVAQVRLENSKGFVVDRNGFLKAINEGDVVITVDKIRVPIGNVANVHNPVVADAKSTATPPPELSLSLRAKALKLRIPKP